MMVLSHEFQKGRTMIDYKYFFVYVLTIHGCGLGFLSLRFMFYYMGRSLRGRKKLSSIMGRNTAQPLI